MVLKDAFSRNSKFVRSGSKNRTKIKENSDSGDNPHSTLVGGITKGYLSNSIGIMQSSSKLNEELIDENEPNLDSLN